MTLKKETLKFWNLQNSLGLTDYLRDYSEENLREFEQILKYNFKI